MGKIGREEGGRMESGRERGREERERRVNPSHSTGYISSGASLGMETKEVTAPESNCSIL
jgi:hypothetical protein